MLNALTLILVCQLAGELATAALGLPVPGPVLGMVLLCAGLIARAKWQPQAAAAMPVPEQLARVADGLLGNLSLLFVPAGVGVMVHAGLMGRDWLPISAGLVVSTLATIAVTGLLMRWLAGVSGDAPPNAANTASDDGSNSAAQKPNGLPR